MGVQSNQVRGQKTSTTGSNAAIKLAAALIIIVVVTAITLMMYFQTNPTFETENKPSSEEYGAVERALSEGRRIDVASPDRRTYEPGDSGMHTLVMINRYPMQSSFYLNIILEELGGELSETPTSSQSGSASQWFNYPERINLDIGGKEAINIEMEIPESALAGSYMFRVLVCNTDNCVLKSGSMYDSSSISLNVAG